MTTTGVHELLALHGLAVKKAGTLEDVASVLGAEPDELTPALDSAVAAGRAVNGNGTYILTPLGRTWLDGYYPAACADLRENQNFLDAYERFEAVNTEILAIFTRWQTVTIGGVAVPNDHQDEDYDNKIIDQLGDIHERAEPIIASFAAVRSRFSVYADKFAAAYDNVLAGEKDWVSGAKIDSYHTVWFELHEDILRLLGRQRRES